MEPQRRDRKLTAIAAVWRTSPALGEYRSNRYRIREIRWSVDRGPECLAGSAAELAIGVVEVNPLRAIHHHKADSSRSRAHPRGPAAVRIAQGPDRCAAAA